MNQRIRELAEQAWDAAAVRQEFGHPVSFADKLSRLIVEECASRIQNYVDHRIPASQYPELLIEDMGADDEH